MSFECHDCSTSIPGSNCAYELSYAMGWKKKAGCYAHCKCGYPVRAKEVRDNIFPGKLNSDKNATTNAYIYCETSSGGGHVYYGTYNTCVKGNGLSASRMSSCSVFNRYGSAS